MSGVPPGLTVGLVLFSIFKTIWMEWTHTKIVDNAELGGEVDGPEARARDRLEMGQQKMHKVYKVQYKVLHLE